MSLPHPIRSLKDAIEHICCAVRAAEEYDRLGNPRRAPAIVDGHTSIGAIAL